VTSKALDPGLRRGDDFRGPLQSAISITLLALLLAGCPFGGAGNTKPAASAQKPVTTASAAKPAAAKPATPAADPTEAEFRRALELMQARDYAQAEPLLAELTRRQPQLSGPWLNLGILYARTQRRAQAIEALRKGLALNPNSAPAQNQLGILLREAGELKAAEQAYRAALAASPDYAYAHLNLGVLYDVHLKQPALALQHYEQCRQLAPADGARVAVWIADLKQRSTATGKP
jgi:tetratricopeptide (TPR) repeat protein